MQERWLSVEEIATHLGLNRDTIYKWLVRKRMPAHKVGRLWKFFASEVDAWMKAGKAAQTRG
jgi:excisionase family DNA binding protein